MEGGAPVAPLELSGRKKKRSETATNSGYAEPGHVVVSNYFFSVFYRFYEHSNYLDKYVLYCDELFVTF